MRKSASLALLTISAFAQQKPTAEQILDRYVDATGTKAAYEKIKSEISTGTMEMKAQGVKGRMTVYRKAPGMSYSAIEIDGVGKIEEGVANGIVWEKSPLAGPRIKQGEEKALSERDAILSKDSRWRELFSKVELTGEENIDSAPHYRVVVTPNNGGRPETRFYDPKTGLLRRMTLVAATQMGDVPVETNYFDYKEYGGIKGPARVITRLAGQEMTVTVNSVVVNQDIPASRFELPADIKALAGK